MLVASGNCGHCQSKEKEFNFCYWHLDRLYIILLFSVVRSVFSFLYDAQAHIEKRYTNRETHKVPNQRLFIYCFPIQWYIRHNMITTLWSMCTHTHKHWIVLLGVGRLNRQHGHHHYHHSHHYHYHRHHLLFWQFSKWFAFAILLGTQ